MFSHYILLTLSLSLKKKEIYTDVRHSLEQIVK